MITLPAASVDLTVNVILHNEEVVNLIGISFRKYWSFSRKDETI